MSLENNISDSAPHWIMAASEEIEANCGFEVSDVELTKVDHIIGKHWAGEDPERKLLIVALHRAESRPKARTDYSRVDGFWSVQPEAWMIRAANEIDCTMKMPRFDLAIPVAAQIIAVNYRALEDFE